MDSKDNIIGGLSDPMMADDGTRNICKTVKQDVQLKTARNYVNFDAITYRSQLVAGTNYFIKVNVGGSDYIHITVFSQLPCNGGGYNLCSVQEGKTLDDKIEPF
ncbi:Cystatin-B [Merluccius polli]|uniref:Cystatin-B n=1 Tax=Merluccius polli TaxID=89951 RepID=A0AA47MLM7_MERPO|nr:Cystatin-B [Merluccius polli]